MIGMWGLSCSAVFFSDKFVMMAANIITAPTAVAEAAATAAGLTEKKEKKKIHSYLTRPSIMSYTLYF